MQDINLDKNSEISLWEGFAEDCKLTSDQLEKFKIYYRMLNEYNELFNITTITSVKSFLNDHFRDSIIISKFLDLNKIKGLVDVGTGGGFPGIPLKILYPDLFIVLIEVTGKKIAFLRDIIRILELKNIEIFPLDWRTFLRKTEFEVDLFCSRASLNPEELVRLFSPSCIYKDSLLVYWGSKNYIVGEKEKEYFFKEEGYTVGNKPRKLIFFKRK